MTEAGMRWSTAIAGPDDAERLLELLKIVDNLLCFGVGRARKDLEAQNAGVSPVLGRRQDLRIGDRYCRELDGVVRS